MTSIYSNILKKCVRIYINNAGYELYLTKCHDKSTLRLSFDIYIKTPAEEVVYQKSVSRMELVQKNSTFDFLLDLSADFDKGDIEKIRKEVYNKIINIKTGFEVREKMSLQDILTELGDIVSAYKMKSEEEQQIFYEKDFVCIRTGYFKKIIEQSEIMDTGYTVNSLLKLLKMGDVICDMEEGRLSSQKKHAGKKIRVYKFRRCYLEEEKVCA